MDNPENQASDKSFGERLRELRRRAGLSQEELAEQIDVDLRSVRGWELGEVRPLQHVLTKLFQILPDLKGEASKPFQSNTRNIMRRRRTTPLNHDNNAQKIGAYSVSQLQYDTVHIRISEEPLTAQNLLTIISALTELSTKYWLIAKGRFADLIEYTQTHNGRFAEEANIVITRVSYNSPFNMDWKVDITAPSVAQALVATIDGITQRQERLEKAKLENQAKALEIKEEEQKAEQENQMALLEQEKQRLELEQRRLEVLEKQLEVQKKGIEYALEIAEKVVDTLHPGADPATRAMEIQALLPNLVQLQNGKGLELALPPPPKSNK